MLKNVQWESKDIRKESWNRRQWSVTCFSVILRGMRGGNVSFNLNEWGISQFYLLLVRSKVLCVPEILACTDEGNLGLPNFSTNLHAVGLD